VRGRFLTDEDVPRSTARCLREAGHEATDVRDVGLASERDETILEYAVANGLTVVTCDVDFASGVVFRSPEGVGIVLVRIPDSISTTKFNEVVLRALSDLPDIDGIGHLVVIRLAGSRVRALTATGT
jgi:predicted nuclease of predicted toxin-antitoxin system